MFMLLVFLVLPLGIMFAVSILAPGDYGGVKWGQHTWRPMCNFLWERDLDDARCSTPTTWASSSAPSGSPS
jgi:spermidine/putrescine transport system permease protein